MGNRHPPPPQGTLLRVTLNTVGSLILTKSEFRNITAINDIKQRKERKVRCQKKTLFVVVDSERI